MKSHNHRPVETRLTKVAAEDTGFATLDGNSVLADSHRAWRAGAGHYSLRDLAAYRVLWIERIFRAVGCAAWVPGVLPKIGLLEEGHLVRRESFKAAIVEFLGPHARKQVAEILHELAVLQGTDFTRIQKRPRDLDGNFRGCLGVTDFSIRTAQAGD